MKGKLSFVHYISKPGGIEVLLLHTIQSLQSFDCKVFVIRPPRKGENNVYEGTGINVTYGHRNNFFALVKFWKFLYKNRNSIIHVFNLGPFFLLAISLIHIKNLVYSIRGSIYWKNPIQKLTRKIFWKLAVRKNHRFIANSEYSKMRFQQHVNPAIKIDVVYNPVERGINSFSYEGRAESSNKIIYTGRLANGKNLFLWLELAAEISRSYPQYVFELYGEGPLEKSLQDYASRLGIQKKVKFMGFRKDIENAYKEACLMIFLSEYESFGNVVIESILCGTPVITSSIPSMKEIFENYPEFLVENNEDIKKTIINKISQIDELRKLVRPAREEFMERFSLEQHIQKLEQIYNSFHNQEP